MRILSIIRMSTRNDKRSKMNIERSKLVIVQVVRRSTHLLFQAILTVCFVGLSLLSLLLLSVLLLLKYF